MELLNNIKRLRHNVYLKYFRLMPIEKNKLMFFSNNMMSYSCNPKYLTEYILKNYPDKYDIVWVFSNEIEIPSDVPQNVRKVRYFSIEYLKEISTSKFVICNTRIPSYFMFKKRVGQYYIQTWHGPLALKVIEKDAEEYLGDEYKQAAKYDSSQIDMIPASNHLSEIQYKNGFWYDGDVMTCGTPRCDLLFDNELSDKLRRKYKIEDGYNVLLYAPTFRNNRKPNIFGIDFESIKQNLERKTSSKWKIMFKLHPNLDNLDYRTADNDIINIDSKADLQELLIISDILITDYSSCMFDMGLMRKKCILYIPDLDDYIKNERKLYFDITALPFPKAVDNIELIDGLLNFKEEEYLKKLDDFYDMIGNYENGNASEKIEKYISEKCFGK